MGARTDAARAEVLSQRGELAAELERLEAAGRAAVDVPAKVRRAPAKTAGLAAGAAFLALGGPQRLFRRARRVMFGPEADLPKSMLPDEVEKTLKKLGTDGDKVRGTLEREFVRYLDEKAPEREGRDPIAVAALLLGNILRPVSSRAGKEMAERLFQPEPRSYDESLARIRVRRPASGQKVTPEDR